MFYTIDMKNLQVFSSFNLIERNVVQYSLYFFSFENLSLNAIETIKLRRDEIN